MKNNSRTKNVTKNAFFGLTIQILTVFIEFFIRTIFIKCLGSEYLGVNGLFTNVLTILSFAELGIGNAIIFSMYREIANENIEKIKSLMSLYKKAYKTIGCIVLSVGLCITPFLKFIINGTVTIRENLYFIYILFLLNTVSSYFFSYKKSIIQAYQKNYIVDICKFIAEVLKAVLQISILVLTKNFVYYLLIQIICTLFDNIIASIKADKMFVFLKDKDVTELNKEEKKGIFSKVKALILYKFGSVILNGTDNIIISKMLGLISVGIVSNFNLLINTITQLLSSILNGFTASIGNLNTNQDLKRQKKILFQLLFFCFWLYGFCAIAFFSLSNNFIELWIGKNYQLPLSAIFAIVLNLYVNGVQFAGYTYRTTLGLFEKGKLCPIIAAIINIILSVLLCNKFGITGIIIATSISRLTTTTWYDIHLVYKYHFKESPFNFYLKYILYALSILFVGVINYVIISLIPYNNIIWFILKAILCVIIPNLLILILYRKTEEFNEILVKVKGMLWKKETI